MNRHVLITGTSKGIGRECAQWFINNGDQVSAVSRSGGAPDGVAGAHRVDVSDSTALNDAVKSAVSEFGPLDVAVINAGVTNDGLAVRMTDEQWRSVMAVNLDGAFFTARAALSSMIRARRGSIIFVGSVSPYLGVAGQANYAAAKAGVGGLARSLAKEVASRNITVNVVAPGFIATDMTSALGDAVDGVISSIPLGRVGDTADVAQLIGFLSSDGARYITGAIIPVDGGLAMGL
jgi:3-oxoacyl-[acyl-carrier protein] reductase